MISRTEADIVSFQYQKIQNLKDVVEQALPHEYEVLSREQAMRLFLQERLIGISMCTKLVNRKKYYLADKIEVNKLNKGKRLIVTLMSSGMATAMSFVVSLFRSNSCFFWFLLISFLQQSKRFSILLHI